MSDIEIYAALTEIFHDLFGDDSIVLKPETAAADIEGWDSFNHVNLIVATEVRFGVTFQTKEIEKLTNVGDLVTAIKQKLAANS